MFLLRTAYQLPRLEGARDAFQDLLLANGQTQIAYLKTQLLKVLQRRQSCEGV